MSLTIRLASFVRKNPKDKLAAVRANLLHLRRMTVRARRSIELRRGAVSRSTPPGVLASARLWYAALRPDSDVDFGLHPELRELSAAWVANNRANNSGDLPRLYALAFNVKHVLAAGVPGDVAELGVYRGNSAAVLARYARSHGRSLLLFDTFEGFSQRDLVGVDAARKRSFADTSLRLVQDVVGTENATFIRGFFPETVTPDVEQRRYAVVHLDCDLYEPIKAGLEFFFPRLSVGGLLIVHDYSNPCWEGVARAVDEYLQGTGEHLVLLPDKSGTAMLRKSRET